MLYRTCIRLKVVLYIMGHFNKLAVFVLFLLETTSAVSWSQATRVLSTWNLWLRTASPQRSSVSNSTPYIPHSVVKSSVNIISYFNLMLPNNEITVLNQRTGKLLFTQGMILFSSTFSRTINRYF